MDDFITIGTQMKIERPGKACAITPSDNTDGPWVVLNDGRFLRIDDARSYSAVRSKVGCVWDNGELVLGYGEFMENNKTWFQQDTATIGGQAISLKCLIPIRLLKSLPN